METSVTIVSKQTLKFLPSQKVKQLVTKKALAPKYSPCYFYVLLRPFIIQFFSLFNVFQAAPENYIESAPVYLNSSYARGSPLCTR